jgi:hypothetical protein
LAARRRARRPCAKSPSGCRSPVWLSFMSVPVLDYSLSTALCLSCRRYPGEADGKERHTTSLKIRTLSAGLACTLLKNHLGPYAPIGMSAIENGPTRSPISLNAGQCGVLPSGLASCARDSLVAFR